MKLIPPTDPQYFEQSSYEPYDRHQYRVDFSDGRSIMFDDYEQLRAVWFEHIRNWDNCTVTVLDKNAPKKSSTNKGNKGFKV